MELNLLKQQLDDANSTLLRITDNYGVGNESISPQTFVSVLTTLNQRSRAVINKLLDDNPVHVKARRLEEYDLGDSGDLVNWMDMGKTHGFKVVGSSSSNYELAEFLLSIKEDMTQCGIALKTANATLSGYIMNPDGLSKFSGVTAVNSDRIKTLLDEFKKHFDGTEGLDRHLLRELYPSYKGYNKTSSHIVSLTEEFDDAGIEDMKRQLDALDDTLKNLIETIKAHSLGKEAAKRIGSTVYNLADWVAIYSMYLAKLISLEKAHRDNVSVIIERSH